MGVEAFGVGIFFFGFIALIVAFFGVMIWLMVVQARKAKERRRALVAHVTARGYSYAPEVATRASLVKSSPFGLGDSRRARDVVWGTIAGRPFETFAYSYETHTTDSKGHRSTTVHHYQVTWVTMPVAMQTMRLTPDGPLQRLFAKMGAKDLEVESHEFNQRWKVWCADERIGHAVLTPAMIQRLLAPGWYGRGLVLEGQILMTYAPGKADLLTLEAEVSSLYGVLDSIPAFLLEDGGAR